jgi:carbonic anhydrase/acetyltransferase-like protein (isoleucine patch superfamily)
MHELISPFAGKEPRIHSDAQVDLSARVIGDVLLEEGVTIWPMAVLRADSGSIRIGRRGAVLDLALIEAPDGHPVSIGEGTLISHGAIVHGAIIEAAVLVGMGVIILDGAVIHTGSVIGAGSIVTAGTHIPPNSLVIGVPGKVIRETTRSEREDILTEIDGLYRKSRLYR